MTGEANYVGAAVSGADVVATVPMKIDESIIKSSARENREDDTKHVLETLNQEQVDCLRAYLTGRLSAGAIVRNRKAARFAKVDKLVSTWQKLSPMDSQRELMEHLTGKNVALPFNLPILASHLNDFVSYFAEVIAPVSKPFFSAEGTQEAKAVTEKFNRDANFRDYYSELGLVLRSLFKYNLGGFVVQWETGSDRGYGSNVPGNRFKALDMYNTFWDPSIRNPKDIPCKAEWAAHTEIENRLTLIRKALKGEWVGLEKLISEGVSHERTSKYYKEPSIAASMNNEGEDGKTSPNQQEVQWAMFGMGLTSDLGPETDGFECTYVYANIFPGQLGLLSQPEREDIITAGEDDDSFMEIWRFVIIGSDLIVDARPILPRDMRLKKEYTEIPMYLSFLTQDQIREAQRSPIELMRGFQRFGSAMFNIFIEGMRKNVWGVKAVDPTMFDPKQLEEGETAVVLKSTQSGRDVRTGYQEIGQNAGVTEAMNSVVSTMELKDKLFPSQALPNQVAGIDRAVKSQVSTVIQGAQRTMRTLVRTLDSSLLLPMRLAGFRNLKRFDKDGIDTITDEAFASMVGSGIESMESERVWEVMWQLFYAMIQNQEAMQIFSMPDMFAYMSRVGNLSIDLSKFVRQTQQPQPAPEDVQNTGQV